MRMFSCFILVVLVALKTTIASIISDVTLKDDQLDNITLQNTFDEEQSMENLKPASKQKDHPKERPSLENVIGISVGSLKRPSRSIANDNTLVRDYMNFNRNEPSSGFMDNGDRRNSVILKKQGYMTEVFTGNQMQGGGGELKRKKDLPPGFLGSRGRRSQVNFKRQNDDLPPGFMGSRGRRSQNNLDLLLEKMESLGLRSERDFKRQYTFPPGFMGSKGRRAQGNTKGRQDYTGLKRENIYLSQFMDDWIRKVQTDFKRNNKTPLNLMKYENYKDQMISNPENALPMELFAIEGRRSQTVLDHHNNLPADFIGSRGRRSQTVLDHHNNLPADFIGSRGRRDNTSYKRENELLPGFFVSRGKRKERLGVKKQLPPAGFVLARGKRVENEFIQLNNTPLDSKTNAMRSGNKKG
ncbi:uncharacterized protein LOC111085018 [Limulus polyphemus]|uniref:Uncharacterized protein LOC111085018 n=1 Tax=Limulus polyphemus TaxID=6850 RepID=A0ABM1S217_LIMPO|nr:uncharacterized protein LOC111085018 [Limulus polyphemus]XP_022237672.1 uncharacterized protein LOC111085018 [Limulus polyphemus]